MEMQIVDNTELYKKYNITKYIEKGLEYIPSAHLTNISEINICDDIPDYFKFSMQGAYYPHSEKKGSVIVIFIDPATHYMLRVHKKQNIFTDVLDKIFMITIGKSFIVCILFHEIGHHDFTIKKADYFVNKQEKEEEYAKDYEYNIYRKMYPLSVYLYDIFNAMYHFLYRSRIAKGKNIRIVESRCGITTG